MTDLKSAADALDVAAMAQANALAEAQAMPLPAAWSTLIAEFVRRAKERTSGSIMVADGRSARWRVRIRLYNTARMDEAEADSDPDLPADRMGAEIIEGLPGVTEHLAVLATAFHKQACAGLDNATLLHRLKGFRPTLSRRGGEGTWRVPYRIYITGDAFKGDSREQDWLARVDVERVAG